MSNRTYMSCHHCGVTHPVCHVTPPGWEIREVVGINDGGGFTTLNGFVCGDCIKRQAAEPMPDETPREALADVAILAQICEASGAPPLPEQITNTAISAFLTALIGPKPEEP